MTEIDQIASIVGSAQRILIIQADNPDADSLASALALEQIIHDMGKEPLLYCAIDMPDYLKYLSGWDRVENEIPTTFDATIIVDTSALSLLQKLEESATRTWVVSKPVIVLDHHDGVPCDIPYATVVINDGSKVSTGEVIYGLAKQLGWSMALPALECVMTSILADSMGLTTQNVTPDTYRVMAELVEAGVSRPRLEEIRRAYTKMPAEIFKYKATLIERTEIDDNGLAILTIPQNEISQYSPLYNPGPLIQPDQLQTEGVRLSVVLKSYDSGRVTGTIRCNNDSPIAAKLATHFGGGGHAYAAGFKLEGKLISDIRKQCKDKVTELLAAL